MSVALVHYLHPEPCTVEDISPSVNNMSVRGLDRLVEVEPVEVESHGADAEGGKPDSNDRPGCKEEMK